VFQDLAFALALKSQINDYELQIYETAINLDLPISTPNPLCPFVSLAFFLFQDVSFALALKSQINDYQLQIYESAINLDLPISTPNPLCPFVSLCSLCFKILLLTRLETGN
jgi:hypothetical protein